MAFTVNERRSIHQKTKTMLQGQIAGINTDKGFAFVKSEGRPDTFFHKKAFQGAFARLRVNDRVEFEIDEMADRPRAKLVVPLRRDGKRTSAPQESSLYGHVVKFWRHELKGFISPVDGGKEVAFEPRAVREISFHRLNVGQYVEYKLKRETTEEDAPEAYFVAPSAKPYKKTTGMLPRHPKSRGRKPTWRDNK